MSGVDPHMKIAKDIPQTVEIPAPPLSTWWYAGAAAVSIATGLGIIFGTSALLFGSLLGAGLLIASEVSLYSLSHRKITYTSPLPVADAVNRAAAPVLRGSGAPERPSFPARDAESLSQVLKDKEQQITQAHKEIEDLKRQVSEQSQQLTQKQQKAKEAQSQQRDNEKEIQELRGNNDQLTSALSNAQARITTLEREFKELKQEYDRLKENQKEHGSKIDASTETSSAEPSSAPVASAATVSEAPVSPAQTAAEQKSKATLTETTQYSDSNRIITLDDEFETARKMLIENTPLTSSQSGAILRTMLMAHRILEMESAYNHAVARLLKEDQTRESFKTDWKFISDYKSIADQLAEVTFRLSINSTEPAKTIFKDLIPIMLETTPKWLVSLELRFLSKLIKYFPYSKSPEDRDTSRVNEDREKRQLILKRIEEIFNGPFEEEHKRAKEIAKLLGENASDLSIKEASEKLNTFIEKNESLMNSMALPNNKRLTIESEVVTGVYEG